MGERSWRGLREERCLKVFGEDISLVIGEHSHKSPLGFDVFVGEEVAAAAADVALASGVVVEAHGTDSVVRSL